MFNVLLPLNGQLDQGQISGTVQDASTASVAGASVTAVSAQGVSVSAKTGENGSYVLTNLPVGMYDLTVQTPGFKQAVRSQVKVDAAARTTIDILLEVGALTESVTVTASSVQIQRETAQMGRTVEARQITDLALNGRNPINLTLLKAGVVGGNFNNFNPNNLHEVFSINGGRRNGNNVTIDGVNASRTRGDMTGSAQVGLVNVDTIQEVQILTSTYPAEYGRAMDGQIRFVTKSGGRDFHGTAWEFLRNSALDANSWTRNQSPNPDDSRRAAPLSL
ncbi:MAG: TonB-dependent receptor [Hymenobacter sp.]